MSLSMLALLATTMGSSASGGFDLDTYKAACREEDRIYASCAHQSEILERGLEAAAAEDKPAIVILGFNDCPPCFVMERWMETAEAKALLAPYLLIELSILDPQRDLRPEVFADIVPSLNLPINSEPPFGVPYFFIMDPKTRTVLGEGIAGFDSQDQSRHIAYLKAHAGDDSQAE